MNIRSAENEVVTMKRYSVRILLLSTLLISLWGCAVQSPSQTTKIVGTGAAVGAVSGSTVDSDSVDTLNIHITVDAKNKVSIPDPALAGREVNISLRDPDQEPVLDHCEQCNDLKYGEYCDTCKEYYYQNYFTDLSFAGFKKPAHVSSFAIGSITENNSSAVRFYLEEKGTSKEEKEKGNCLALFVTDKIDQNSNELDDSLQSGENYLVILDYENKCCYKTKTDFFNHALLYWNDMTFTDLTGDGIDELVIQHNYNKSIDLEIHRLDEGEKKLKKIFSTWDHDTADCVSFSGHLEDNYKAVLKYKNIGFTETVSLLEAGYKKEQLEIENFSSKLEEFDDYRFVRLWKNGSLQAKGKEPETVFLYALDDVAFKKNEENIPQLRLMRLVDIGHRSEVIGKMYTYFQYDEKKDAMELSAAKFKIER